MKKQTSIAIVNVKSSTLAREADFVLECFAGPEISVASTKGFTTQLTVLLLLTLKIAEQRKEISLEDLNNYLSFAAEIPGRVAECLNKTDSIKNIALKIAQANTILYTGRNYIYPVALEGALKLKELSYIHAEAIAAGELKHGPIALIDENVPVIVLAPFNNLFEKTVSNAQEIAARNGKLICFSSSEGNSILKDLSYCQVDISSSNSLIEAIIYTIPMQLLAYYVAIARGTDVDQPRNLAKSVTVE
jgi:glucosamine--fructose-6-phosphate aminotransferase (isomerizing)